MNHFSYCILYLLFKKQRCEMLAQCMICDFLLSLYQTTCMSSAACHWWCSQRCVALWHSSYNSPLEFFFCIIWCPDTFGSPHLVSKISFPPGILAVSDWLQQLQDLPKLKCTSSPGSPLTVVSAPVARY